MINIFKLSNFSQKVLSLSFLLLKVLSCFTFYNLQSDWNCFIQECFLNMAKCSWSNYLLFWKSLPVKNFNSFLWIIFQVSEKKHLINLEISMRFHWNSTNITSSFFWNLKMIHTQLFILRSLEDVHSYWLVSINFVEFAFFCNFKNTNHWLTQQVVHGSSINSYPTPLFKAYINFNNLSVMYHWSENYIEVNFVENILQWRISDDFVDLRVTQNFI